MSNLKTKSTKAAVLGLFTAIVVVLQMMSYFIKIGTFNLSLVLIPIVLAAVMYGPKYAGILGGVFGAVVAVATITGLDAGAFILFSASPVVTVLLCFVKGIAAGVVAGLIARPLVDKNLYLAVILAAVAAPVVNTGIFIVAMFLFFREILAEWAAGADLLYFAIFGLVGINFLIELLVNVVLSPVVLTVTRALAKVRK
ncbi:MAG: ECF transporter S component [Acutalibacteraceae bacterium]|jgi:uncharacterized membrane protein